MREEAIFEKIKMQNKKYFHNSEVKRVARKKNTEKIKESLKITGKITVTHQ